MKKIIKVILVGLLLGLVPQIQAESSMQKAANVAVAWGKGLGSLVNINRIAIGLAGHYIYTKMKQLSDSTHISFEDLPKGMQDAVIGMNAKDTINFRQTVGDICCASFWTGEIYVGKNKFKDRSDIQKFSIGHEIAHIQKKHALKAPAIHSILAFLLSVDELLDIAPISNLYVKNIIRASKIGILVAAKPIISRYCEKEADIVAVQKLNCAQAAIDWCNDQKMNDQRLDEHEEFISCLRESAASQKSWLSYVQFSIDKYVTKASNKMYELIDGHPSWEERIAYLQPIADAQKQQQNA